MSIEVAQILVDGLYGAAFVIAIGLIVGGSIAS